jgi:hypothetical protein
MEDGWDVYLLTLMFNQMRGSHESIIRRMRKEVERVYSPMLTRMIREPRKMGTDELPLLIAAPDLPVSKQKKQRASGDVRVNGGLHMHGLIAVPPNTRMNVSLDQHFQLNQKIYVCGGYPLARVHAEPITEDPGYVTEYACKAIQHGRVDLDHIVILPRARSEAVSNSTRKGGW